MKIKNEDIQEIQAYQIECPECGEKWTEMWWENFNGKRCPHCGEWCEIEEE